VLRDVTRWRQLISEYGLLRRLEGCTPQSRGRRFNELIAELLRLDGRRKGRSMPPWLSESRDEGVGMCRWSQVFTIERAQGRHRWSDLSGNAAPARRNYDNETLMHFEGEVHFDG
jgi:hypothetical protein